MVVGMDPDVLKHMQGLWVVWKTFDSNTEEGVGVGRH